MITNGYATLAELKTWVGLDDSLDDTKLEDAVTAASRWIDSYCCRHFWQSAAGTARTFATCDPYLVRLGAFNDLTTVTAVKSDEAGDGTFETTWSGSDYQLLPNNPSAAPELRPYTSLKAVGTRVFPQPTGVGSRDERVEITGTWGWPAIPQAIEQACLILAAETLKLKDAPFGVAGFGEYGSVRVRDNPKIASLVSPYRLTPILVG